MIVGSRQRSSDTLDAPKIELGVSTVKRVIKTKTLGVIIDEKLTWKYQIENVITKVSKGVGMIRRMKKYVPKTTLLKVYDAIVLSHFDYCSLVWDNCADYLLDMI